MLLGFRYPLINPRQFDTAEHKGFRFVQPAVKCRESDTKVRCWVLNDVGQRHPDLGDFPIQIATASVDEMDELAHLTVAS